MRLNSRSHDACWAVFLIASAVVGCSASENASVVRRDSAGVQIVENAPFDSGAVSWWTITGEPQLDIGTVEGSETEVLFKVADAVRLGDGRIVIANSGNGQVRFYSPDANHIVTSGRQGGGPGEFQRIAGLLPMLADSIGVIDAAARRVSVLAPDGRFSRMVQGAPGERVSVTGYRVDGTWVAQSNDAPANNAIQSGLLRPGLLYVTLPADGGPAVDTLGRFPGIERVVRITENAGTITSINIMSPPFAKSTTAVTTGNDLVVGTQDAPELRVYDRNGGLRRIVRTGTPTQRVTPDLFDTYIKHLLERVEPERHQEMRENQLALLTAKEVPAYGTHTIDRAGNLWVQDYPDIIDDQRWTVFDSTGARIARIAMPRRFTPYDIGPDWILGRELDELDVEHVRLYAIRRAASGR